MNKFMQDLKKFPPYQWGVGIGNSLAVNYTDGPAAKVFKRAIFNVAAPIATVFSGYQLAMAAVALVTFPFVAAPIAVLGSAAYSLVVGAIFTPWIAGISENGMKENIELLKAPFKGAEKSPGRAYGASRQESKMGAKNRLVAKFKSALGLDKKAPKLSIPIVKEPKAPK